MNQATDLSFGSPGFPILFQGMLGVEPEAALDGLFRMGHRYYDASTGRFLTRDLLSGQADRSQTLNRYTYALSNPLRYVDPWGLSPNQNQSGESLQDWLKEYFQSKGYDLSQVRVFIFEGSSLSVKPLGPEATSVGESVPLTDLLQNPDLDIMVHELPHGTQ